MRSSPALACLSGLLLTPSLVTGAPATTNTTSRLTTGSTIGTTEDALTLPDTTNNATTNTEKALTVGDSTANNSTTKIPLSNKVLKLATDVSGPWMTLTCTADAVVNQRSYSVKDRWDKLYVPDCWKAVLQAIKGGSNVPNLSFSALINDFFHGKDGMNCQTLAPDNGCGDVSQQCQDPPSSYVPGFEILNAMSGVNAFYVNTYTALGDAQGAVTTQMGTFASTFSPTEDKTEGLKILLDIIGLGFALSVAPLWNSVFKKLTLFANNGNTLGTIKDSINPLVSNGVTLIKDSGVLGTALNNQNKLTDNMGKLVGIFQQGLTASNKHLFDGSDDGVTALTNLMADGKSLELKGLTDSIDATQYLEAAIFGIMIPRAWSASNMDIHPFIGTNGNKCDGKGGTDTVDGKYLDKAYAASSSVCVNGQWYHLAAVEGEWTKVVYRGNLPKQMEAPPGVKALTGDKLTFGGVKPEDLTIGAVNTWAKNGNKNGGGQIDASSTDFAGDVIDNGIKAAGIVTIPVCTFDEAHNNWQWHKGQGDNYPCN